MGIFACQIQKADLNLNAYDNAFPNSLSLLLSLTNNYPLHIPHPSSPSPLASNIINPPLTLNFHLHTAN